MTPTQVNEMPANDVYMILYARKANYINAKVEQLIKDGKPQFRTVEEFNKKYGEM